MNILIIEDENNTAQLLKEMIENQNDCKVVSICQCISSSVLFLKKNQKNIDLIFMDIQLADGDSFEIFNKIKVTVPVIFCTAFDTYMLDAFKNNGIEYILKPFQQKDIDTALNKVHQLKQMFFGELTDKLKSITNRLDNKYQSYFLIQNNEKMIPLAIDNIALIFIENVITYFLTTNNEKITFHNNIDQVETLVDPKMFYRVNRQMLVNRSAISNVTTYFHRKLKINLSISTPMEIIVSRLKVKAFKKWLEKPV